MTARLSTGRTIGLALCLASLLACASTGPALAGAGGPRGDTIAHGGRHVRPARLHAAPAGPALLAPQDQAALITGLVAAHLPHGVDRASVSRQSTRLLLALLGRSAAATARAAAASAPTTTSTSSQIPPGPGEVGSGATETTTTAAGPGKSGSETSTSTGFATSCPDASGYVPARGGLDMHITTSESQRHRLRLLIDVVMHGKVTATAHTLDTGKPKDYDASVEVSVTTDVRLLGPAGLVHGEVGHGTQTAHFVFVGLDPHGGGMFEKQHIGSISLNGHSTPYDFAGAGGLLQTTPDLSPLVGVAYLSTTKMPRALEDAERNFYDDAKCLKANFSPAPLEVKPGSTTAVSLTVLSTRDGGPVSIDANVSPTLNQGTVAPAQVHAAPSAPAQFQYTAPSHAVQESIHVGGTSRRGRLAGSMDVITSAPDGPPYYYRVLSASYSTHSDGRTDTGNYTVCESHSLHAGGTTDGRGSAGTLAFSSANTLSSPTAGGPLSGRVWADVPSSTDLSLFGCTINPSDGSVSPCQQSFPTQHPSPDGTTTIGFAISAASASAATATLHWSVPDPEVGVAGGGSDPCNAPDVTQTLSYDQLSVTVPMSQLASTSPETFSFSGGPLHWNRDAINQPVSLNYQWQYRLTVQRVRADGGPVQ